MFYFDMKLSSVFTNAFGRKLGSYRKLRTTSRQSNSTKGREMLVLEGYV